MTLEDLIDFLCEELSDQALTAMAIRRTVLLAYEMGLAAGIAEIPPNADYIVTQINTREAQSLEALRREAQEDTP